MAVGGTAVVIALGLIRFRGHETKGGYRHHVRVEHEGPGVAPASFRIPAMAVFSLIGLASLGAFGGYLGGAPVIRAALRVTLDGVLAMAVAAAIGHLLGVTVG